MTLENFKDLQQELLDPLRIQREIDRRSKVRCEQSLTGFIKEGWHVLEPGVKYVHNWHIDAMCDHLEAVERNEIDNLIINVPPGAMKSLTVSVFYPAWVWGPYNKPWMRWIYSSYSGDLSNRDSRKCRDLILSDWYKGNWGERCELTKGHSLKTEYETTQKGIRTATSVGGTTTGKRGDRFVIDDPLNVKEATSEAALKEVKLWWDQVVPTRINDPRTGKFIIIMQRIHQDDLVGHIMQQTGLDNWNHLNLPGEYEKNHIYPIRSSIGFKDPRRKDGDLLWPEFMTPKYMKKLKLQLGSYGYAGQIQQRPAPVEGGLIKRAWLKYYKIAKKVKKYTWSWDTAIEEKQSADYSCGLLFGECEDGYYLIDLWRKKVEYPELKRAIIQLNDKYPAAEILIEKKASGQQLLQDLKRTKLPVIPVNVGKGKDKVSRVQISSPTIEAGNLFLPEQKPWVSDYVEELITFPNASHDDQVDATTQYILRMLKQTKAVEGIEPINIDASLSSVAIDLHGNL